MLNDKPPSSGTCKFEPRTHLSHSSLEVNRLVAPPEIGFSLAEGVILDDLPGLVQLESSVVIHLPAFKDACGRKDSTHLGGGID